MKKMPFSVRFVIVLLLMAELFCFWGLFQVVIYGDSLADAGIYLFTMLLIALILVAGMAIGATLGGKHNE
jgi:hypothetical protein